MTRMKGLLFMSLALLLLALPLLAACTKEAVKDVEEASESSQGQAIELRPTIHSIELREGDTYTITLESTGYRWQVEFNEAFLELVDHSYAPDSNQEVFTFRALAWGYEEVYFSYSRRHEVICIFTIGVDPALAEEMTLAEAREIAMNSECAKVGAVKETGFYNDWSGTWWIDLDAQREGCSPACVVNVRTRKAEVNWRCTGALPGPPPLPPAPNEAAAYCQEQGYNYVHRIEADGSITELCQFPDGSECEVWAFYRGECSPGNN